MARKQEQGEPRKRFANAGTEGQPPEGYGEEWLVDGGPSREAAENAEASNAERAAADAGDDVVDGEIIGDSQAQPPREVALRNESEGQVVTLQSTHPATRAVAEWISPRAVPMNETDVIVGDIIAQVLNAATPDEVLADARAVGLRDMLDKPFTLHAVKWQRSDFEQGHPFYAVLDVERHDNGWRGPVTTGAMTIIAQLMRLVQLNALPCTMKAVNAAKKPTASGNMPLRLMGIK